MGSNRNSLRSLSRQFPGAGEVKSIINDLRKENDRTVAIVGASLVESALEHMLIASFKSKHSDLLPRLFENRGPLSDFNSKILVAQAFGVVAESQAEEMQRIRHIRNAFAHARVPITFDTTEVHKEVQDFIMLMAMRSVEPKLPSHAKKIEDMPNKSAYLLMCNLILIMFDHMHRALGGRRLLDC